ncbi:CMGC kinase, MAPK family (ERK) MAPK-1 [Besnoitia besnoiti]|uniref:CMGC kinase, MAPK family (ERK) MAPK-1 n=1 Tax=Besnoitia besnoiti TaxID=94643 RepID=A0A2A9M6X1_BESBE|nr:CMGC kinase, MAPK family (ERK) MAPK-1 [Besnoitia besnoiti]PFH34218.1 CMGC kinase, MAPK family (ERK) MAPK-1 [Besnoitia besnoiti]
MSQNTGSESSKAASSQTHRHRSSNAGYATPGSSCSTLETIPCVGLGEAPPGVPSGSGTVFCEKTYKVKIDSETVWKVPTRLKFVKKVGSGAYGCVASFEDTSGPASKDGVADSEGSRRQETSGSRWSSSTADGTGASGGDSGTNKRLAVKKIGDLFRDLIDAKRIYREIKILKELKHENIIDLVEILDPLTPDFDDIYLVSDLMDTDLHRVIYSRQPLTAEHHQYFLYQLLLGLSFLHQADIIHRDLKPSNILVNLNCDIKICDFGLARGLNMNPSPAPAQQNLPSASSATSSFLGGLSAVPSQANVSAYAAADGCSGVVGRWGDQKLAAAAGAGSTAATRLVRLAQQQGSSGVVGDKHDGSIVQEHDDDHGDDMELTDYVVTRWYRPPEILISPFCYSKPVDLWSVGCIFAELLGRRALFAGKDHFDQLRRIVRVLGRPSTAEINKVATEGRGRHFNSGKGSASSGKKKRSEAARRFIESLPNSEPYKLEDLFPDASKAALDLLSGLLAFDPAKRITVQEALRHEYFEGLHSVEDEPHVTTPVDWSFDNFVPTKRLLQNKVYSEILSYHPEIVLRDFHLLPSRGIHIAPSTLPPYIRQPLAAIQQQQLAANMASSSASRASRSSGCLPTVSRSASNFLRNPISASLVPAASPVLAHKANPNQASVHSHPGAPVPASGFFVADDRSLSAASTAPPDEQHEALNASLEAFASTAAGSSAAVSPQLTAAAASAGTYGMGSQSKKESLLAGAGSARGATGCGSHGVAPSEAPLRGEVSPALSHASYALPAPHATCSVTPSPQTCSQSLPFKAGLTGGLPLSSPALSAASQGELRSCASLPFSGASSLAAAEFGVTASDSGSSVATRAAVVSTTSPDHLCSASSSYAVGACPSGTSFASLPVTVTSCASTSSAAGPFGRKSGGDREGSLLSTHPGSNSDPLSTRHTLPGTTSPAASLLKAAAGSSAVARSRGDLGISPRLPVSQSAHPYIQKFLAPQREAASSERSSSALVYRATQHHAAALHHGRQRERGCSNPSAVLEASGFAPSSGAAGSATGRSASLPSTAAELVAAAHASAACLAPGAATDIQSSCVVPLFSAPDPTQGGVHALGGGVGPAVSPSLFNLLPGSAAQDGERGLGGGQRMRFCEGNDLVAEARGGGGPLSCGSALSRGSLAAADANLRVAAAGRDASNSGQSSAHGSRTTTQSSLSAADEAVFFLGAAGEGHGQRQLAGAASAMLLQQYQKEIQQHHFAQQAQLAQHKRCQTGDFGADGADNNMNMSIDASFGHRLADGEHAMDVDDESGDVEFLLAQHERGDGQRPPSGSCNLTDQQLMLLRQQL